MLTAKNISKSYDSVHVLKGVSLNVKKGEVVSIVGSSGAGKSTLLHILGTLDKADQGEYQINSQDVFMLSDKELSEFRNKHIGFIFQFHHLLPEFSAIENVCIPAFIQKKGVKESEERAKELLNFLGLNHRFNHKPSELSGGEQQRVAVARALMNNPDIVMADEPSGNLDTETSKDLHELFFRLRDEYNQTFIIVTHNQDLANMADRKLEMKDGVFINN